MSIQSWRKLHEKLTIADNGLPAVRKPTLAQLDQWERESGLSLPLSYREFIRVFGPGVLAWSYRIMAPGYSDQGDSVDLALFNQSAKSQFTKPVLKSMRDPDRIRRVVYCVRTDAGDLIGWDPEDIWEKNEHECRTYKFGRLDQMEKVADSFGLFIEEVALSEENLAIRTEDEKELGTRYLFEPASDLSKTRTSRKRWRKS